MIKFTVHLLPVPKGRPRCVSRHGRTWMITPDETRSFERVFRLLTSTFAPPNPLDGPLRLWAWFFFPKPKSVKREHHTVKPDGDNLLKAVADAMEGSFFVNDSQVIDGRAFKLYGSPRIEVELEEVA